MTDTEAFLRHVLPEEGEHWYVAAIFTENGVNHQWVRSPTELAVVCCQEDTFKRTVYFACGIYRKRGKRSQANSAGARSFWLDVDAGEGKAYIDAVAAYHAVEAFCRSRALPRPTYVASGTGLHVYWALQSCLEPETWKRYASGLKSCCNQFGLAADPSRTADLASILRPPGTHHRKSTPRLVECGELTGPYSIDQFAGLLDHAAPSRSRSSAPAPRLAAALADVYDDEPRYGSSVADSCAQLGALRSTRGNLNEPLWYACLGVLAFCDDGEELAHEWSSGYDGYTPEETQGRFDRGVALSGATTCAHFHGLNPKTCEACPHWQKIKSPISLGRSGASSASAPRRSIAQTDIFGAPIKAQTETRQAQDLELPDLPHDFFWRNDGALITKTDAGRGSVDIVVSRYPIFLDSIQTGEVRGEFNLIFRQRLPERGWMEINLSAKIIFGHGAGAELADRGANIHEHNHFMRYVRGAIDQFYGANRLSMRYDQFGWKDEDNAFLYGLDLYNGVGVKRVMGNDEIQIRCKEDWVGPCKGGDVEGWKQSINALFASGCEPQSIALLASFAAPLMRFQERDEGGAIIHLVTRESGTGKSTALIGASSVWGRREGLGLTNEDTKVSKALTLGALGNLPVVFDEIAIRDPEAIRAFVINFTNGRDKMRATRGGEIKHTASTWQTILISAANTSLVDILSTQNTPEAPAYRILEFPLNIPDSLRHVQGDKLRKALRANSGHAGKVYMDWLTQPANLAWTKAMLEQVTQQTWLKTNFKSEHRFWVRTIAAIAVAGVIVKQLALIEFSIERIMSWLFDHIGVVDKVRPEWAVPALSEFLNDSISNALVVPGPYVSGHKTHPIQMPHQRLTMRYEVSTNRILIAASALREYLVKKELSYQEFIRNLEERNIVTRKKMQATLAAGTQIPGGQIWCVEINAAHEAVQGVLSPVADNVVAIRQ